MQLPRFFSILQRHLLLVAATLMLSLPALAQESAQGADLQALRFSERTLIRSTDGGQHWQLVSGDLSEVPVWAQAWLQNEGVPATVAQISPGSALKMSDGTVLQRNATDGTWQLGAGERANLPDWAHAWLPDAPRSLPPNTRIAGIESLCNAEAPVQRTRNLRFGEGLTIRSYDDGRTWELVEGQATDLPEWVRPWLQAPAPEVLPAKELAFGEALLRSVDGGKTWTQVQGELADLPAWVRPWVGVRYVSASGETADGTAVQNAPSLFPNPTSNSSTLRFQTRQKVEARIALYDLQGKLIQVVKEGSLDAGTHELEISLADLPAGPYFLRVQAGQNQARIRLLKAQ